MAGGGIVRRRDVLVGALATAFASSGFLRTTWAATPPATVTLQGKPTSSGATVRLRANQTLRYFLEYGYAADAMTIRTPVVALAKGLTRSIRLTGLKPDSIVHYRLRYALGAAKTFRTLATSHFTTTTAGDGYVFAVQADPHMDENSSADVYKATLSQVVAAAPAFLMDLGDIFMVDKLADKTEANIRARFTLMKDYYARLGAVPLYMALGNHDGELGYSNFNTKRYRAEYFPEQTGDLAYYSFTGPDSLFIVLDPFTYTVSNPKPDGWAWTLGRAQYDWLVKTLTDSQARRKFVFIHHLLVGDAASRGGVEVALRNEWGGNNLDGTYGFDEQRRGWGKPVHQVLKENGVGFVFKGHDHLYVKQELDGIVYQTVPQPSHAGDKLNSSIEYGYREGTIIGGSGFLRVTSRSDAVQVDFVKHDGSIADTYIRSI